MTDMTDWAELWEEERLMREACEPTIKELKLKGLTYGQITKEIQKTYPNISASTVSKIGLKALGSMHDYRKNSDGTLTKKRYQISIDDKAMDSLDKARERLRMDWGMTYLPSYSETIKDLLNKC
jgi:hypothetical protein